VEIGSCLGLSVREVFLWWSTHENRLWDRNAWNKTTPMLLRAWYQAFKAEIQKAGWK
jgi:hypothetical protein